MARHHQARVSTLSSFAALLLLCSAARALYQPPKKSPSDKTDKSADKAATPVPDHTIGGDANKRYFLIKPSTPAPASGYKLLIVLPGGDGGADFNPFVTNIAKQAAPGYLVVQAVAPAWSKAEDRIVWPTAKSKDPKAKFTTEEFLDAIIADVKAHDSIDPKHIVTLGWSSGGPPCYAAALKPGSPITGSFIAMSVFKPDQLPSLDNAKGKAFYILHSPTDFIKMNFPEAARDQLAAKGAKTKLDTYEGGHGWHGDVFSQIKTGIQWIEANSAKPAK